MPTTTQNPAVNIIMPSTSGIPTVQQAPPQEQEKAPEQGRTNVKSPVISHQPNPSNGQIGEVLRDFYGGIDSEQIRKNTMVDTDEKYLQNIVLGYEAKMSDENRSKFLSKAGNIAAALGSDQTDLAVEEMVNEIYSLALERESAPVDTELAYANMTVLTDENVNNTNLEWADDTFCESGLEFDEDGYYQVNALDNVGHEYVSTGVLTTRLQEQKDKLEQKQTK